MGLNYALIRDETLRAGFVIMAAVPPAVAVIPFTFLLNGDSPFSLVATIGCYLGALVIMPLMTLTFLGEGFADSRKLVMIMAELIFAPLVVSRVLRWSGAAKRLDPWKGALTNWSFALVTYTIVGLNRNLFLNQPLVIAPVAFIALASTFLLGFGIEGIGRLFRVDRGEDDKPGAPRHPQEHRFGGGAGLDPLRRQDRPPGHGLHDFHDRLHHLAEPERAAGAGAD